jgi:hypothetical protein
MTQEKLLEWARLEAVWPNGADPPELERRDIAAAVLVLTAKEQVAESDAKSLRVALDKHHAGFQACFCGWARAALDGEGKPQ